MTYKIPASLIVAATAAALPALSSGATTPPASAKPVSLSQEPVVMRLSKDEFRIAFGINADRCGTRANGCNGVIRYRVDWKTEDGTMRSEIKRVSYAVVPRSSHSLTVDRQYFDTAEGAHTTEVVKVSVDMITCVDGAESRTARTASIAAP
jgi:hypothetical protein